MEGRIRAHRLLRAVMVAALLCPSVHVASEVDEPTPLPARSPCDIVHRTVFCGWSGSGDTDDGSSAMSSYSCSGWAENGPEEVWPVLLDSGGPWRLTATLSDTGRADLDVFILGPDSCNSDACVAYGDEIAVLDFANGNSVYYVVVDGFQGDSGSYNLEISCQDLEVGSLGGAVLDRENAMPPCTAANVSIEPGGLTSPVDPASGGYGPEALLAGAYTVTASAAGYEAGGPVQAEIADKIVTILDFHLDRAVARVAPTDLLNISVEAHVETTFPFNVFNDGHLPLEFLFVEGPTELGWVWQDPVAGLVSAQGRQEVDVSFLCGELGDYSGTLSLHHGDPCTPVIDIPVLLHCVALFSDGFESGDTRNWTTVLY